MKTGLQPQIKQLKIVSLIYIAQAKIFFLLGAIFNYIVYKTKDRSEIYNKNVVKIAR